MFGAVVRGGEDIRRKVNYNRMQTVIYLVRHGAYENPQEILHLRSPGFPLSAEGKLQAEKLKNILADKPITTIFSSPLTRAQQTAQVIASAHGLPVTIDERLIDVRSPLQGKPLSYAQKFEFNFYRHDFIVAGGERLSEVFARMDSFIGEKIRENQGKRLVVVSHGDPIMAIKVKYLGGSLYSRRVLLPDYVPVAGGYEIVFAHDGQVRSLASLVLS